MSDRVREQKPEPQGRQVLYLGRYVDYHTFRVFVYAPDGSEMLATNYEHYRKLVGSGNYFSTKEEALQAIKIIPTESKGVTEIEEQKTQEALEKIKEIKAKVSKAK